LLQKSRRRTFEILTASTVDQPQQSPG